MRSGAKFKAFLRVGLDKSVVNDDNKVLHSEEDVQPPQNVTYTVIKLSELLQDDKEE